MNVYYQCPYPGCFHVGEVLTKFHCETEHNLDKEELINTYGVPKMIIYDSIRNKKIVI